jgi:dihydrofolate reductase
MTLPVAMIVAVGANGVIGEGGGLPWRIRADLGKFRALTMGKPLVMGRKTFESIGRPLDGRDVIVLTRRRDFAPEGVFVAGSLDAALRVGAERAALRGAAEICIAGGGEIYREAMPLADRLYVTHVAASPEGDTRFPEIAAGEWEETARERLPEREGDTAKGTFVVYRRRR